MNLLERRLAVLVTVLTASAPAAAAPKAVPFAQVVVAQDATLAGKPIRAGEKLSREGVLKTGRDGKARIDLIGFGLTIQAPPGSSFILSRPAKGQPLETVQNEGQVRWTVREKVARDGKPSFRVRTQSAVMGVRGTEFITVANPLLGETEIVVFDGEVEFQSIADAADRKMVPKEHWGGVGGRFGRRISDLMHLPREVLAAFDKASRVE